MKSLVSPINAELYRRGAALFEQQMWCWGCDVRCMQGNLFTAYGLEKRPSTEPRCPSAYCGRLRGDGQMLLWGWGIWASIKTLGTVYIGRSPFTLRFYSNTELTSMVWREADLLRTNEMHRCLQPLDSRFLLMTVFTWIGAYETWIATYTESTYRERTIASWPQRSRYRGGISATAMPEQWFSLQQTIAG